MKFLSPEHLDYVQDELTKGYAAQTQLDNLRLSVARLAQNLGISPDEIPAHKFLGSAETAERGWNRLVALCVIKIKGR